MIVRLVIENLFSFGSRKEFNTIPNNRLKTLDHHKYNIGGFEILKTSSIYGANGAGKSNLIKSLELLQEMIIEGKIPYKLKKAQFKFNPDNIEKKQVIAVEFIQENTPLYYGIELFDNRIMTEELYLSGLGKKADSLIFERKTDESGITEMTFLDDFEKDEKSQLLKSILLEEFIKSNEPVLKLLSNRDNKFLKDVKKAFDWFDETLQIITPDSRPSALAHRIDKDLEFKKYADGIMSSFSVGIIGLTSEKKEINEFFGEDNEKEVEQLTKAVEESPKKMIGLSGRRSAELIMVKEDNKIWVKNLNVVHVGSNGNPVNFELTEESDGTIRLLDFVPAFQDVVTKNKVFFIDEIERSIHPLLIKELVRKFSLDTHTKGQLIFTTHESNLLDQEIFRQDEIWFAEKDKDGSSDLYSLSDFKEHKTIDIRKGYLNGRYGSIPFLGNLEDLNWHKYDINE